MLSNIQIEEQVRCGRIKITPFDPGRLGANHYRLSLHSIQFVKLDEEGLLQQGKVIPNDAPYALNAHEYVVVSVREKIVLDHGLFGEFYPASMCIEEGIQLNCGRLGSFYEDRIHFGIFNMRDFDVFLREGQEIARVSFVDLGSEAPIQYQKRNDDYSAVLEELRGIENELAAVHNEREQLAEKTKRLSEAAIARRARLLGRSPQGG
jgi:deoxycytidine triphosphate deaminase